MKPSLLSRFGPLAAFFLLALAPLVLSDFRLSLLGQFLAYAILAIGLDLIWGYTGIMSLGHAVYFGLGGYCIAMFLKLEAFKGQLPDFMSWSGLETLPFWWKPFTSAPFAIFMAMAVPTTLAALLGYFTFRNRIKGVFFAILSQALSIIVVTLFVGQQAYTGGTNGITDYQTILGQPLNTPATQRAIYFVTLAVLTATFFLCRKLVNGKFGQLLVAIRDGENRLRFTGYNPVTYKVFVYALSAALAGLAGALYVPQVGIISPSQMGIVPSIGMLLWVAIGGRGTLSGPIVGAILVNTLQNLLSEKYPDGWSYLIGSAFILVVLFFPRGIMGGINDLMARFAPKRSLALDAGRLSNAVASK